MDSITGAQSNLAFTQNMATSHSSCAYFKVYVQLVELYMYVWIEHIFQGLLQSLCFLKISINLYNHVQCKIYKM